MVTPVVVKADRVTRKVNRWDGGTFIEVQIPAAFFAGLDPEQGQDIYRLVARDTYVWGMEKFGWPEPPQIPGGVPAHAARITPEDRGLAAPEAGRRILMGFTWKAPGQRRTPHLNERLTEHRGWQDYLTAVNPDEHYLFTLTVDADADAIDRDAWQDAPLESDDEPTIAIDTRIPPHYVTGSDEDVEDTYLRILTDTYAWVAHEFDWPTPPR